MILTVIFENVEGNAFLRSRHKELPQVIFSAPVTLQYFTAYKGLFTDNVYFILIWTAITLPVLWIYVKQLWEGTCSIKYSSLQFRKFLII